MESNVVRSEDSFSRSSSTSEGTGVVPEPAGAGMREELEGGTDEGVYRFDPK